MPILGIPKYLYQEPERLSPSEARLRRVQSELDRVESLERARPRLSPVNKFHFQRLKEFESKFSDEIDARRERVRKLSERDSNEQSLRSRSLLKSAILAASNLQQRRTTLRQRADAERRANILREASAPNRRYDLPGFLNPRSIFGTEALTGMSPFHQKFFKNPLLSIPCIQRAVRREVMFAKGHGHKAHRGRRRRGPLSAIGC